MQAKSRGARSIVFAWALAASVVLHAAILIATLPGGRPGIPSHAPPDLRVALVEARATPEPQPDLPAPVPPVLAAIPEQPRFTVPMPQRAPPAPLPPSSASRPGFGAIEVVAEPLANRARLGDYLARQMKEFPVEIDRPVRIDQKIAVRYPASALAQGREDAVAVWVLVDAEGNAEEIYVADGTEEFANEVVAAVRAAHFLPAEDNLKPIRYPISLQFEFRAGGNATAQAK